MVRRKAVEANFQVVRHFEEVESASTSGKRPQFRAMIEFFHTNPHIRDLLVLQVDRAVRNLFEYTQLRDEMGIRIHAVLEPTDETPMGRYMQNTAAVQAEFYSDRLSALVKERMRKRFEEGGCISRAPVGLLNVPRTRTSPAKVVPDKKKAPVIRGMFERYARGDVSLKAIALELADNGMVTSTGKSWSPERVRRMLKNPVYCGYVKHGREVREGLHEGIVSRRLYERVQRQLRNRSRSTRSTGSKFFLLRGLLSCAACGNKLTAEHHERGSYYLCFQRIDGKRCNEPYIPVSQIEDEVAELLASIQLSEDDKNRALENLRAEDARRERARVADEPGLLERQGKLARMKERLIDLYAQEHVPAEVLDARMRSYDEEFDRIADRLSSLAAPPTAHQGQVETIVEVASSLTLMYEGCANKEERRDVLRRVFKDISVKDKKIVGIEYQPDFEPVLGAPTLGMFE